MTTAKKKDFRDELADATGATEEEAKAAEATQHYQAATPPATGTVEQVAVKCLRPSPHNPRGAVGDVGELARSIAAQGLLVPLLVRPLDDAETAYEVVSGHRRLKAAQEAGLDAVPCDIRPLTDVQALEVNLTEQINKKDLTPIEEGYACRKLVELSGYSVDQVAGKLGQSPSWVTKRMALCGLAPEAVKAVVAGEVPLGIAQALAALPSQRLQVESLATLTAPNAGYTVGETVEEKLTYLREEVCRSLKGAPFDAKSETLVPEAGACTTCPHNSANARMPGLFDNTKGGPTCANPPCFASKADAAWAAVTAKQKAAGAKVLSVDEGAKLFRWDSLQYGSKYVEASAIAPKDKQKRTWKQLLALVAEEARPQLHVARDNKGKVRELYLEAKALESVAKHLKLKWAQAATEGAADSPAAKKKAEESQAQQMASAAVFEDLRATAFRVFAKGGLPLVAARMLAQNAQHSLAELSEATRLKLDGAWLKKATPNELLALAWWWEFDESYGYSVDLKDDDVREVAKAVGLNLDNLLKAQLEAQPKAEEKPAAKKKATR